MVDLMQSEIGVQIVAFFSVVLLAFLTYVFGFKSNSSSTENNLDEKQRQSPTRQSISSKSKKQTKSLDTPPQAVPSTPKQQQVKKAELKSQKQQVAKKSEVKQQEKKLEQEEKVQFTNNNEEESNGEWITVKDKKQKKNQIEEKTTVVQPSAKVKVPAKEPEPKKTETVTSQPEALTANQEAIKEKKPKKDSIPKVLTETAKQAEQAISQKETPEVVGAASALAQVPAPLPTTTTTTAASVQPKKTKAKAKPTVAEPVKSVETTIVQTAASLPTSSAAAPSPPPTQQQVPKLDLLTSSLNELNMNNSNESDWIQANSKAIKKTKLKQQSVPVVVAAAPSNAEQVPAKNKSKSVKQANKQVVVEQPEIPAAVAVVAEAAKPVQDTITVPKPLEAAKPTIFSPNTIAATIIESKIIQTSKAQLPIESLEKTIKTTTDNSNNNSNNTTTASKKQKNVVNMSQLKQTNLSDSMILIDSNASSNLDENFNQVSLSGKNSSRTDSNQSSSESLQDLDVDGDDGWATITSKKTKRTTVRREQ